MKTQIITFIALLAAASQSAAADESKKPARSPELQVLQRFAGTWDHAMTIKLPDGNEMKIDRVDTRRWSPGGTFMIFENSIDSKGNPEVEELYMIMGYDPKTKTYPVTFLSAGSRGLMRGTWDEKTRTMHWTGSDPDTGNTFEGKHVFTGQGKAEVNLTVKDPGGDLVVDLSYKQTRRKKAPKKSAANN